MEAGNRRKFSREFKVEAVRMANEGNRSMNAVARELGLHANVLAAGNASFRPIPKMPSPARVNSKNQMKRTAV